MKRLLLLVGLLVLTVSCMSQKHLINKKMNTERLVYFSFDQQNAFARCGEKYEVGIMKDGRIHVVIDEGFPGEKELYLDDSTIFDELLALVKTYKMDKYKSNYQPEMQIFDGDSWSLYYKYDSQRSVSSGGYMAWPDNYREMRRALSEYFQKWRDCQVGVVTIDYFKFTCKNNQGRDQEFTLERGEKEATVTLRDAERGIDKSLKVSNNLMKELQERANSVQLKSKMYDYYTEDEDATRCTYFVRYNTGDTVSGITCYDKYPSHKASAILDFFNRWYEE